MARKRMIAPDFWDDEAVGVLSSDERLLIIGLISMADDQGKLTGSISAIKRIVFGFTDVSNEQVEKWLINISSKLSGVHLYEIDGKPYIALLHWWRYQKLDNPSPSAIPDPENVIFDPLPRESKQVNPNGNRESIANQSRINRENGGNARGIEEKRIEKKERIEGRIASDCADSPSLSPLTKKYIDCIWQGVKPKDSAIRKANLDALEIAKHPNYDEDTAKAVIAAWAKHRLADYRRDERNNGQLPPLQFIGLAIRDVFNGEPMPGQSKQRKNQPQSEEDKQRQLEREYMEKWRKNQRRMAAQN